VGIELKRERRVGWRRIAAKELVKSGLMFGEVRNKVK
jgi:hypothetical protein